MWTLFFGLALFFPLGLAHGKSPIEVETSTDGKKVRFQVFPSKSAEVGLLEVLDDRTGEPLRTVQAGFCSSGAAFTLPAKRSLPPGRYRARFRQGIELAFDRALLPPQGDRWINPCDLVLTDQSLYVLDSGRARVKRSKDGSRPEEVVEDGKTVLYKFRRDGAPDPHFGEGGRVILRDKPSAVRCIAVDEFGLIYVPLGGHYIKVLEKDGEWMDRTVVGGYNAMDGWTTVPSGGYYVEIWDGSGKRLDRTLGGYRRDGDPGFWTPKGRNTQHVNSVALGPDHRIYLHILDYGALRVFDRSRNGLDACLYSAPQHHALGGALPRTIASDRKGAIYLGTASKQILKIEDSGTTLKAAYASESERNMIHPTGMSVAGDLIWVAACGPAEPFWDSEGGAEVLLFWDTGQELRLIEQYGKAGTSGERLEFMNPSATAQSSDHLELWVAEDGMANAEGPPGNARVRRFKITASESAEAAFILK